MKSLRNSEKSKSMVERNILEKILSQKRAEVQRSKERLPAEVLRGLLGNSDPVRDFVAALGSGTAPRIIAEVKRASPSKGVLRGDARFGDWDPVALAQAYERGGAACLSVLTDGPNFWGSADTLVACREAVALPTLRKDFIVDPYQVYESRWLGADAILLMASVLQDDMLQECAAAAQEQGLHILLEVHDEQELERALAVPRAVIGINHRDLRTLELDMDLALALRRKIPKDRVLVAESGLSRAEDLQRLLAQGIRAFLIGGHLAASDCPEKELERLGVQQS